MVKGSGLLAKCFKSYRDDDGVIIFASGVANSGEAKKEEFEREYNLLSDLVDEKQVLVYFSTCSVFDQTLAQSPYVLHKKEMENFITREFENFIIFRLPTVLGDTTNPHTLFNFFIKFLTSSSLARIVFSALRLLFSSSIYSFDFASAYFVSLFSYFCIVLSDSFV